MRIKKAELIPSSHISNLLINKDQKLVRNSLASSSVKSAGMSFSATELHFLGFLTLFCESYLQIPIHSPIDAPDGTESRGTLFSLHKAFTIFL